MNSFEEVYKLVSQIPRCKVSTYGAIAKLTKINPRMVGFILHQNKDPKNIPCHRIVKSNGKLATGYAFGGLKMQKKILKKEGIKFDKNGKVDLNLYAISHTLIAI